MQLNYCLQGWQSFVALCAAPDLLPARHTGRLDGATRAKQQGPYSFPIFPALTRPVILPYRARIADFPVVGTRFIESSASNGIRCTER